MRIAPLPAQTAPVEGPEETSLPGVLVYPIEGEVTAASMRHLQAAVRQHVDELGVRQILFEINTPGGDWFAAMEAANFIVELDGKGIQTVAYIPNGGWAISAGALLSLACQSLVMGDSTQIGAAQVIAAAPFMREPASEKLQSPMRNKMGTLAEKRRYPRALAEAMVSPELQVSQVRMRSPDGTVRTEYLSEEEIKALTDALSNQIEERPVIVRAGELLTLSEDEAYRYGFIPKIITTRARVLEQFGFTGPLYDPAAASGGLFGARAAGAAAGFWAFLNHPAVKFLLLVLGVLGFSLELKAPGFGLAGTLGLVAFAMFFLAGSFDQPATVGWIELTLFVIALGLLALEVFALPGFGLFGIVGLGLLITSLVLALMPGSGQFNQAQLVDSLLVVLLGLAASVVVSMILLHYLPRVGVLSRSGLISTTVLDQGVSPVEVDAHGFEAASRLVGAEGVVVTALRPAGKAEIAGQIHDVVAEGDFLSVGERVQVTAVEGYRIVVRGLAS